MAVVSLLTDFGLADHFVGVMKGVIQTICPGATVVDISHEVNPYELSEASFLLEQSWRYFPKGTVHIAVVDPGVGSDRRAIAVKAAGHYFVAPDNGLLSRVLDGEAHEVRHLTAEKYFLQPVSQTFHGRDVFAPVGAHLASGVPFAKVGKKIDDYQRSAIERPVRTARRGWTGAVLHIDRFGNVITNFPVSEFPQVYQQPVELWIGLRSVDQLASSYAAVEPGQLFMIAGSSGYLEVSTNQGHAARMLGVGLGAPVELRLV